MENIILVEITRANDDKDDSMECIDFVPNFVTPKFFVFYVYIVKKSGYKSL